jgi:dihydrofolate reductase
MRKLKLEMQVSIDGFASDANGDPSWMLWCWSDNWTWDNALRRYHTDLTISSDCILLSRKMAEEGFCEHWEKVAENAQDPQSSFAKPISDMRKLVFSKSGFQTQSRNAEVVRGDLRGEIEKIKRQDGKDILAYGGPIFASSLVEADLIDEFHLFINPTSLGSGRSMFKDLNRKIDFNLVNARSFECGLAVLEYSRKRR